MSSTTGASIWQESLPAPRERYPGGKTQVDVAVIGAGASGLSAAFHLLDANSNRSVVVLERQRIAHGASSRSTGMLTPGVGQNLVGLVKRLGEHATRTMYQRTLEAIEYARELCEREEIDAHLRMTGQFVFARGPAGRKRLDATARAMEQLDLPVERLDDDAFAERIRLHAAPPACDSELPAALRLPTAGLLDPVRLAAGLAAGIEKRGGTIFEDSAVVSLGAGSPAPIRIEGGGEIVAQHVVLATNGYSSQLGFQGGRVIPVHLRCLSTEQLSAEQLDALGWPGREGTIDSRRLFNYFRLTEDGRLVFGGGRPRYRWGGNERDYPANEAATAALEAELHATFGRKLGLRVDRSWTGLIGFVLDGLPVMQRLPSHPCIVIVGGWCGHGVALSLISGKWVTYLIDRGMPPEDLPWFRHKAPLIPSEPARFVGVPIVAGMMALMDHF